MRSASKLLETLYIKLLRILKQNIILNKRKNKCLAYASEHKELRT